MPGSVGGGGSAVAVGDGGAVTVVGVSGAGPGSGPRAGLLGGVLGFAGVCAGPGDSGGPDGSGALLVGVVKVGVRDGHVGSTELRASSSI